MKFQSLFRVCLIFYTYDSANFKSINTTMKKMLLATALALLITGCAQIDVYCSKQTGSSSTKGKPSLPIISSFLELGRRKLSMQPKFVAAQKMLLKTETQQTFVNGLLGFITLGIYTAGSAYCHWPLYELPIDMGNSHLHCSLIYFWVPSSCFCRIRPSSLRVK